jgi:CRISPR-associated protein Cmr3
VTTTIEITCRDPIVSRDGRPFGAGQGNRMRSAGWPLPSVVAGSLRSTIGKAADREFSVATAQDLLQVEVAGLFPLTSGQLHFPAPQDCVAHPEHGPLRAKPHSAEVAGCDLPVPGLRPVGLTEAQAPNDFKPEEAPAWWPAERYAAWLAGDDVAFDDRFLRAPETEARAHVQLDPDAGAAEDGKLFTTTATDPSVALRCPG